MFTYSVGTSRRSRPSASQKAQRKVDLALGFEPHLVPGRCCRPRKKHICEQEKVL